MLKRVVAEVPETPAAQKARERLLAMGIEVEPPSAASDGRPPDDNPPPSPRKICEASRESDFRPGRVRWRPCRYRRTPAHPMQWLIIIVLLAVLGLVFVLKRTGLIDVSEAISHLRNGAVVVDVRTRREFDPALHRCHKPTPGRPEKPADRGVAGRQKGPSVVLLQRGAQRLGGTHARAAPPRPCLQFGILRARRADSRRGRQERGGFKMECRFTRAILTPWFYPDKNHLHAESSTDGAGCIYCVCRGPAPCRSPC